MQAYGVQAFLDSKSRRWALQSRGMFQLEGETMRFVHWTVTSDKSIFEKQIVKSPKRAIEKLVRYAKFIHLDFQPGSEPW